MPGVVGLISKIPSPEAREKVNRMVQTVCHGVFDEAETWSDDDSGTYVGWVTPKQSFSDTGLTRNERGDTVLVFSGEEYPSTDEARRLKERGRESGAAAGYLVHVYEDDSAFPASLNGRFHGLVADRTRGTVLLFNDRWGMHRLYYYQGRDAFYFAAEAKAILAVCPECRVVDTRSLGELITSGCVLENRAIFDKVRVLPPASSWVFRQGSLERQANYFAPHEWEEQSPLNPSTYYQELRDVFSSNLPRYFEGPNRIGMSLTGGMDTRLIMAWQKSPPGGLPCYSFGGMYRESEDVRIARRVARACAQPFEIIHVGEGFLSRFPEYAARSIYLTDGCTGVEHSPDLYANEMARDIAPVRMTGNYGGEVLRGIRAFKATDPMPSLFSADLAPTLQLAKNTYAAIAQTHPLSFAVFRQAPWHHYGLLALEQTQVSLRSPFLDNDLVRTVFRAPGSGRCDSDVSVRLVAEGNHALSRIRTDRGPQPGQTGTVTSAISKALLTFTAKAEYAYDSGMPQWLADVDHRCASWRLERFFLGRHKFAHFRVWFRDKLAGYIREMLLDPRALSRPYLNQAVVCRVVERHIKGDRNYTTEIQQLLTLELLHRLFVDAA